MQPVASNDPVFLETVESWCATQPEVLTLIRYRCGAGSRDYQLFSSYKELLQTIQAAHSGACITVFKNPNFPIRGTTDEKFIAKCLALIPDGAEYLLIETNKTVAGKCSWYCHGAGTSHKELKNELQESVGIPVIVGFHPPMSASAEEAIDGVVPDADGIVRQGPY